MKEIMLSVNEVGGKDKLFIKSLIIKQNLQGQLNIQNILCLRTPAWNKNGKAQ